MIVVQSLIGVAMIFFCVLFSWKTLKICSDSNSVFRGLTFDLFEVQYNYSNSVNFIRKVAIINFKVLKLF